MTANELLRILDRKKVKLTPQGSAIRIEAPRGVVGSDLLERIRSQKREILSLLTADRRHSTRATDDLDTEKPGSKSPIIDGRLGCDTPTPGQQPARTTRQTRSRAEPPKADPGIHPAPQPQEEPPPGDGWYDSNHDYGPDPTLGQRIAGMFRDTPEVRVREEALDPEDERRLERLRAALDSGEVDALAGQETRPGNIIISPRVLARFLIQALPAARGHHRQALVRDVHAVCRLLETPRGPP